MKIQEALDNILRTIRGKDVRQSIHDGIEQCYKDATGHPESVAAVIEENKQMQEHLDNTPYTIMEEGEKLDLPVYTINDEETSTASTWSSEKISKKIEEVIELVGKILNVNYQHKESDGTVYFDKAFNNVVMWIIIGKNYGEACTGYFSIKGIDGIENKEVTIHTPNDGASYGVASDGSKAHAKTVASNENHATCYYDCYQVGYN